MKKSIKLNIPKPCNEGWENMTPAEKGRYCSSCEKVVIDFTNKNDEDLVKELSGAKNVCGRFKTTQLNRELKLERKSGINLAPYAASLLLPLSILASNPTNNKSEKPSISLGIGSCSEKPLLRSTVTTTGRITDENGKGIPGVSITVKESGKSEVSGLRGHYQIKSLNHDTLVFEKDGFDKVEITVGSLSEERDLILKTPNSDIIEIQTQAIYGNLITGDELVTLINGKVGGIVSEEAVKKDSTSTIRVSGVVSDEIGPLPGANVIVKGTTTGVNTDFDGNFSLEVKPDQTLVISYLGFLTQEIPITGPVNSLAIVLEADDTLLEGEIIVVGGLAPIKENSNLGSEIDPEYRLETEEDYQEWKSDVKQAHANEKEFRKIKAKPEKEQRRVKRTKRKRK